MAVQTESNRLGDILFWEEDARYAREDVTVASGQNLTIGTVIGKVTATGKVAKINFTANDGSETAYGIIGDNYDATSGDVKGWAIVRDAIINDDQLVWPSDATSEQKAMALATLAGKGVITRRNA